MAKFSKHRKILAHLEQYKEQLNKSVEAMGVIAVNHFTKSFKDGGFTDETLETWKPRKRTERSRLGNRAILVKSGRLRRSLRSRRKGGFAVVISTDVPYAQIHNEGGTINKKEREHILNFNKKGGFQRQRTERQRAKTSYAQKVIMSAHTIKMPKRQFIGYSGKLNRLIISKFDLQLKRIFNK